MRSVLELRSLLGVPDSSMQEGIYWLVTDLTATYCVNHAYFSGQMGRQSVLYLGM